MSVAQFKLLLLPLPVPAENTVFYSSFKFKIHGKKDEIMQYDEYGNRFI